MLIQSVVMEPQIVHFKKQPYDVYIGRPSSAPVGSTGEWGNPFSSKPHAKSQFKTQSKAETLWRHREWVLAQPALVQKIKQELRGKILGCWCDNPYACHGQVLWEIANDFQPEPDTHKDKNLFD